LAAYNQNGYVNFSKNKDATIEALVQNWLKNDCELSHKLILAHRNKDVDDLNDLVREKSISSSELKDNVNLSMKHSFISISNNERVMFAEKAIINGNRIERNQFATIKRIELNSKQQVKSVGFLLDGSKEILNISSKTIKNNVQLKFGYAATVHKAQGATIPHVYTYLSGYWDRNLTYVANTRHQLSNNIFVNEAEFKNIDDLSKRCSRKAIKDSVLDFPLGFAIRRGFMPDSIIGFKQFIVNKIKSASKPLIASFEKTLFPEKHAARQSQIEKIELQKDKLSDIQYNRSKQRELSVLVATFQDANRDCGKAWAAVASEAKELGHFDFENNKPLIFEIKDSKVFQNAKYITQKRNAISSQIVENIDAYKPIIKDLGINDSPLVQQAQSHKLFEAIKDYKQHSKLESANKIKSLLNKNHSLYPQYLEANIDNNKLNKQVLEFKGMELVKGLSGTQLIHAKTVIAYQKIAQTTSISWRQYFYDKENNVDVNTIKSSALANQAQRDSFAYDIQQNINKYQPYLNELHINTEKLNKQSEKHELYIAPINKYEKDREMLLSVLSTLNDKYTDTLLQSKAFFEWRELWASVIQSGKSIKDLPQQHATTLKNDIGLTKQLDNMAGINVKLNYQVNQAIAQTGIIQSKSFSLQSIHGSLNAQAPQFVETLLGAPNKKLSNNTTYSYGNKGSLKIHVSGNKAGLWYDFEQGSGGNLFNLIEHVKGCDFKEALTQAKSYLNIEYNDKPTQKDYKPPKYSISRIKPTELDSNQKTMVSIAKNIENKSQLLSETPAETYLQSRGIDTNLITDNIQFGSVYEPISKKSLSALIAIARNKEGDIQATQAIYLDASDKANIPIPKRSYGVVKGSGVLVQAGRREIIAIAEGVETALSVANTNPNLTVIAALGSSNMANIELAPTKEKPVIVICADNDGDNASSNSAVDQAIDSFAIKGHDVYFAKPKNIAGLSKCDFNDTLQKEGLSSVTSQLKNATLIQKGITVTQIIESFNQKDTIQNKLSKILEPLFNSLQEKPLIAKNTHNSFKQLSWDGLFKESLSLLKSYDTNNHATTSFEKEDAFSLTYRAEHMADNIMQIRRRFNREPSKNDIEISTIRANYEWQSFKFALKKSLGSYGSKTMRDPTVLHLGMLAERKASIVGRQTYEKLIQTKELPTQSEFKLFLKTAINETFKHRKSSNAFNDTIRSKQHHKNRVFYEERYGHSISDKENETILYQSGFAIDIERRLKTNYIRDPIKIEAITRFGALHAERALDRNIITPLPKLIQKVTNDLESFKQTCKAIEVIQKKEFYDLKIEKESEIITLSSKHSNKKSELTHCSWQIAYQAICTRLKTGSFTQESNNAYKDSEIRFCAAKITDDMQIIKSHFHTDVTNLDVHVLTKKAMFELSAFKHIVSNLQSTSSSHNETNIMIAERTASLISRYFEEHLRMTGNKMPNSTIPDLINKAKLEIEPNIKNELNDNHHNQFEHRFEERYGFTPNDTETNTIQLQISQYKATVVQLEPQKLSPKAIELHATYAAMQKPRFQYDNKAQTSNDYLQNEIREESIQHINSCKQIATELKNNKVIEIER